MAEPFIGEIRQVGFDYAPPGWLPCDGRSVPIAGYDALYALIGTTYGGDGISNFCLPDLQGRVMIHQGQGSGSAYVMGQKAGTEAVTLTMEQMAAHTHVVRANSKFGTIPAPTIKSTWAQVTPDGLTAISAYAAVPGDVNLAPTAVSVAGGNLPIEIRQPYVVVTFIIAIYGIFPSQS